MFTMDETSVWHWSGGHRADVIPAEAVVSNEKCFAFTYSFYCYVETELEESIIPSDYCFVAAGTRNRF